MELNFHELPVADAGPDRALEFEFSTYLEARSPDFGTGIWNQLSGSGQLVDENDPVTEVTGLSLGENEFTWIISSAVCEEVSVNVLITVNDVLTPTVITPNNDGYNDYLVFPGVDLLTGSKLIIYNRWGSEVYRSENYQNDWNGRDLKSRDLLPDTYYYVLQLSSGRLIKGFVEIKK